MSASNKWEKTSAITSVLALLISSALGLYSVNIGTKALEHSARIESLAMRPILQVFTSEGDQAHLRLTNSGVGPLTIKEIHYLFVTDDLANPFVTIPLDSTATYAKIFEFFGIKGINQGIAGENRVATAIPRVGTTIVPQQNVFIIKAANLVSRPKEWQRRNVRALKRIVDHLGVCIVYTSLDDLEFVYNRNKACELLNISPKEPKSESGIWNWLKQQRSTS